MVSPSHPRARFGITFSLLARRWRRSIEAHLAASGLTDATWMPLVHLKETGGGLTQKDLATLVGVDSSSLVRVLDILEREGLIQRRRDERDGRARLISLTPKGEDQVGVIRKVLGVVEETILADLSDGEVGALLQQFEVIDRRLSDLEGGPGRKAEA